MIFVPKTKIIVDAFTNSVEAFDLFRVERASSFVPEWWRDLDKEPTIDGFVPSKNMRGCSGFSSLYQKGLIIPLWSDVALSLGGKGNDYIRWQFADQKSKAEIHPEISRGSYLPNTNYCLLKMDSPWLFKTKEEISWVFTQPTWNNPSPETFLVPPGLVNYKYQHFTNVNIVLPRAEQDKTIMLSAGLPMAHIIPLTEKNIEVRHHRVDDQEWLKIGLKPRCFFAHNYNKYVAMKKKIFKENK